jgi:hypothetical protein
MRFGFCLYFATVYAGIALLASPSCIYAQESGSVQSAVAELPDAPRPQFEVASTEPLDQQPAAQDSSSSQPPAQQPKAEKSQHKAEPSIVASGTQTGIISGTVIDVNDDIVPGSTVVLDGSLLTDRRTVVANDNGYFEFNDLKPGTSYHVIISANGFVNWTSPAVVLTPGQYIILKGIRLQVEGGVTSVTVTSSNEQIAIEQVKVEEQQRIFGIIPNFYVVYDPNPVPLTTKLKYKLALKAATDPITFLGVAFLGGLYQAADTPNYVQGAKGYGQRVGSGYADGFTDIFIGGAILPSLLHQDPRYYYQGTGTKKSRALHALASPFVCKGDNGRLEPNYSSLGGDLISGAISNAYYPTSNRGAALLFENDLITTGAREVDSLVQEFILRKLTPKAKKKN